MEEQKFVGLQKSGDKKNREGEKINKTQKEKEEMYTISYGFVEQAPIISAPSKSRSGDKANSATSQVMRGTIGEHNKVEVPNVANTFQEMNIAKNYHNIDALKYTMPPQHPTYPSQYFRPLTSPLYPYSQKDIVPPHVSTKPINYPPSYIKSTMFQNQSLINKFDYIPKELTHLLTQKEVSRYARQQSFRMNRGPRPKQYKEPFPKIPTQKDTELNGPNQRRSRKFQISTNNAHKKFINCLKNIFYEVLSQDQIKQFEDKYIKQKSSRAFFFIMLVYIKYRFTKELGLAVKTTFQRQMRERIAEYEQKAFQSSDPMFKNYRKEEMNEMIIAIKAIEQFYTGNTKQAIQFLYKKGRKIIVKQNHYRASLKSINELEEEYAKMEGPLIQRKSVKDPYFKRARRANPDEDGDRELDFENRWHDRPEKFIGQNNQGIMNSRTKMHGHEQEGSGVQEEQDSGSSVGEQSIKSQKQASEKQYVAQNNAQNHEIIQQIPAANLQNNPLIKPPSNQAASINRSQLFSKNDFQKLLFPPQFPSPQLQKTSVQNQQIQELKHYAKKNQKQEILFPPIPPYFYLPDFDQKYGYLFRKLAYTKAWMEVSQKGYGRGYGYARQQRDSWKQGEKARVPQPLQFTNGGF